jgi:DNA-binding PadR family transcriptional regulator
MHKDIWKRCSMKKKTRYVILGLLRDEALTGYEIKNIIDIRMSFFWQESYGQIYPELNEMLEEGLIKEADEGKEQGGRGKIKYSITDQGKIAFCEWMAEDNDKDTVRSEAMLKFFLADDSNKSAMEKHLTQFYLQNKKKLELYHSFTDNLTQLKELHNNHKYILKMLELGTRQQEVYCNWSEEYLKELREEK